MTEGVEHIGRKDIAWSYLATIFMIGSWLILLPFILNQFPAETVGIWNIFQTIGMLVMILDFGFRPSFARNLSYIFSGVSQLQQDGIDHVSESHEVDYSLLKGTLTAMRRFYRWMALCAFIVLVTAGTGYMLHILSKYTGDRQDAIIAWVLLIIINCYNLYTLYYDALLLGKGYVKRNQQITILGQAIYLGVAIAFIYAGFGLTAIVSAQLVATIIRRVLMYRVFFTRQMRLALKAAQEQDAQHILSAVVPNAVKVGLTQLGGFCVNKSAVLIGSLFLSLEQMACYGITMQVLDVLARCATVYYQAVTPKLAQYRAERNWQMLGIAYGKNVLAVVGTYLVIGVVWVLLGDWALEIIDSQTSFVPLSMLIVMLVISLLEQNHATAAGFIMADNRIPFFIPSLASGAATILLLLLFLYVPAQLSTINYQLSTVNCQLSTINLTWALILAPGIAQLAYQNWKWPSVIIRELSRRSTDGRPTVEGDVIET